jgi:hypothetical protein
LNIFFDEDIVGFEIWRLKRTANAAHDLIDKKIGLNTFVWSEDEQGNRSREIFVSL